VQNCAIQETEHKEEEEEKKMRSINKMSREIIFRIRKRRGDEKREGNTTRK
jgi:hypothetical protein